jgi:hypothetical protein
MDVFGVNQTFSVQLAAQLNGSLLSVHQCFASQTTAGLGYKAGKSDTPSSRQHYCERLGVAANVSRMCESVAVSADHQQRIEGHLRTL